MPAQQGKAIIELQWLSASQCACLAAPRRPMRPEVGVHHTSILMPSPRPSTPAQTSITLASRTLTSIKGTVTVPGIICAQAELMSRMAATAAISGLQPVHGLLAIVSAGVTDDATVTCMQLRVW